MEETDPLPVRRGAFAAGFAFLLLLTSILTPWWAITVKQAGFPDQTTTIAPFRDHVVADQLFTIATGALLGFLVVWLFFRLAARSWHYEPASWRRDLTRVGILTGFALASGFFWPAEQNPQFIDGYTVAGGQEVTALPGIGWWVALLAAGCLAYARWTCRQAAPNP